MLLNTLKLLKYAPLKCAAESAIIYPLYAVSSVVFLLAMNMYLFYCSAAVFTSFVRETACGLALWFTFEQFG